MIRDTLSEREARRFYDAHGRRLEWSDHFEGRAKARAFARADVQPGAAVLEIGTGTGRFLAHALERAGGDGRVVGLDLSPTMLRLSRERAPRAGLVRASAVRLPFPEAALDLVFSTYTLDLLPLPAVEATLAEVRRVLRPGGRAVLCGLTEGRAPLERLFMGLWKRIHRLAPARVGGCRPLELSGLVERAGLAVIGREHVGQLGTPSEVLVGQRPGA